jgi:hypothetical protein
MTLKDKLAAGLKCSKCEGPLVKSKHGFTGEVHCPKCSPNIEPVSPLAAVMALREKATPGPWTYSRHRSNRETYTRHCIGNDVGTGQVLMLQRGMSGASPDFELIVAAVNLLPELEKLLAEREEGDARAYAHKCIERVTEMRKLDLERAKEPNAADCDYYLGRAHRCDDILFWLGEYESHITAGLSETEEWWHKEWHQATGIPCDGQSEYCPLVKRRADLRRAAGKEESA